MSFTFKNLYNDIIKNYLLKFVNYTEKYLSNQNKYYNAWEDQIK
jgi:hypothetical protein